MCGVGVHHYEYCLIFLSRALHSQIMQDAQAHICNGEGTHPELVRESLMTKMIHKCSDTLQSGK